MNTQFRIEDIATSHVGLVRSENEDSHVSLSGAGAWVVADGMGGHFNGAFASRTIVEAVAEADFSADIDHACDALAEAIHEANRRIFTRSQELGQQMGSTVVALLLRDGDFIVMWAGDSRAYICRGGLVHQLTRDHTQVEMMLERGLLSPEEAADHPMKHVLGRAVGVQPALELDAIRDRVLPGDIFILCSDGLHGVIDEGLMATLVQEHGIAAAGPMIEACLARGAPDNVTVTLVAANEITLLQLGGSQA